MAKLVINEDKSVRVGRSSFAEFHDELVRHGFQRDENGQSGDRVFRKYSNPSNGAQVHLMKNPSNKKKEMDLDYEHNLVDHAYLSHKSFKNPLLMGDHKNFSQLHSLIK